MQLREIQLRDPRADGLGGGGGWKKRYRRLEKKPRFLKNPVGQEGDWRPGKSRLPTARVEI